MCKQFNTNYSVDLGIAETLEEGTSCRAVGYIPRVVHMQVADGSTIHVSQQLLLNLREGGQRED